MAKALEAKLYATQSLIMQLENEFNTKQAMFEENFTGNFEMIKNIVLHTDKETMTKIKKLEN